MTSNRKPHRAGKSQKQRPMPSKVEVDMRTEPGTLKEVCRSRDANWNAFRGQQANLERLIQSSPKSKEDVEFILAVMVCAHTELVAREMIEAEVEKTMQEMKAASGGN
jgi:hypothetical protein